MHKKIEYKNKLYKKLINLVKIHKKFDSKIVSVRF